MPLAAPGEGGPRLAVEHHLAAIHHDHAGDAVGQFVDPMFDHDNGRAELAVQAVQHGEDFRHAGGIEIGRRLVQHQKARAGGEDRGDADPLLLPARHVEDRQVAGVREADISERLGLSCHDFVGRPTEVFQPETDLVAHAGVDDLGFGVLEHHADLGREVRDLGVRYRFSAHDGMAAQFTAQRVGNGAVENVEQGALAAPARSEDQHELARLDAQRNPVDDGRGLALIGVGDVPEIDDGRRRAGIVPRSRHCGLGICAEWDGAPQRAVLQDFRHQAVWPCSLVLPSSAATAVPRTTPARARPRAIGRTRTTA